MDEYNLDKADEYFKKVLAENPYYLDAYVRLAYLEFMQGKSEAALKYC